MRLAIAEAQRFPDLASTVSRTARQLTTEVAAGLLREMTQSTELATLPAFAPERLATTARFFLDLVVVPMLMRGLFEEKVGTLEPEIDPHVAQTVPFFLAACRHGRAELRKPERRRPIQEDEVRHEITDDRDPKRMVFGARPPWKSWATPTLAAAASFRATSCEADNSSLELGTSALSVANASSLRDRAIR